ncbi:uncharacterized protein LOC118245912 isoform X2 [Cygnus atratus]|uniref:uncharacterized protein LOC118245912 isoform X2 n=1 Tax=Cygnus atratus TaxID=8868 RepID=UPI0015D60A59|nr:uncharacterized protein LOC118245912 isoform X2 [Cygnus atratus]
MFASHPKAAAGPDPPWLWGFARCLRNPFRVHSPSGAQRLNITSPWASPGIHTATQPASKLNVLQINPTEGRTRREDCSETAQPKKHKCQHRGESEGVRPAGGAAFWQEPRVTGWLQRPQDSRSLRVRNPVFQKRQNAASPFTSLVFCLSCCGHRQILSHPLQLFLTWTCSVICFTHSTEMAQLREQVNPRSVCSHLHARPASQSQGSALLPETFQTSPCAQPLTVLRVDQGHHLPFCSRAPSGIVLSISMAK